MRDLRFGASLVLIGAAVFYAASAFAADLKAKPKAVLVTKAAVPTCTVMSCVNKFYIGAGIGGLGTNANILGNGLQGSLFAGGGIPQAEVGWFTWNGAFLIGVEAGGGYQINAGTAGVSTTATNQTVMSNQQSKGWLAYQEVHVGGSLSALFGNASPVPVPGSLTADVMAPYLSMGIEERPWGQGWRTGAGIKFLLPNSIMVIDVGYRYTNFGSATLATMPATNAPAVQLTAENLVYAKFDVPLN